MGAYLSQPKTEKTSEQGENVNFKYGSSAMQGWRTGMEDAHSAILDFDDNASFFAVYDGHGGKEVALFCGKYLHEELKKTSAYSQGDYSRALISSFLKMDDIMVMDEYQEELKLFGSRVNNSFDENDDYYAPSKIKSTLSALFASRELNGKDNAIETDDLFFLSQNQSLMNEEGEGEGVGGDSSSVEKKTASEDNAKSTEEMDCSHGKNLHSLKRNLTRYDSAQNREKNLITNDDSEKKEDEVMTEHRDQSNKDKQKLLNSDQGEEEEDEDDDDYFPEDDKDGNENGDDKIIHSSDDDDNDEDENEDEDEGKESNSFLLKVGRGITNYISSWSSFFFHNCQNLTYKGPQAGCTAVVVFIKDKKIYVANAGDSRCVLSRNGVAMSLSEDHKPELDEERERIFRAGAFISDGRINGCLNLSRAIGDLEYKQNKKLVPELQAVTALPDIRIVDLDEKDEFLILACDGIWDVLSNQQAVDFVQKRLHFKTLSKICEEMMDYCMAPDTNGSGVGLDNMSVIIVQLNKNANSTA